MNGLILVVEDNGDNMKLVAWALEDHGFAFEHVRTAEQALVLLGRERFDLVLMDISLPGMDGKEATRRIRADPRTADLPVIALTAHAVLGEREAILASGVSDLVTKPVDENVLIFAICVLLAAGAHHG
jgi:two-component system cell cycle response regulator DivK